MWRRPRWGTGRLEGRRLEGKLPAPKEQNPPDPSGQHPENEVHGSRPWHVRRAPRRPMA
jgi:hypothetical protein